MSFSKSVGRASFSVALVSMFASISIFLVNPGAYHLSIRGFPW